MSKLLCLVAFLCLLWTEALSATCFVRYDGVMFCDDKKIEENNDNYVVTQDDDDGEKEVKSYRCRTYGKVVKCVER